MTVTWRSAFSYALAVAALSWLIGIGVELALTTAFSGLGDWSIITAADPWELLFPACATVLLAAARLLLAPMPRWRVAVIDSALYTAVLLACAGITAWAAGDEQPADSAFVTAIFALLSLQLPAAWGLSAWRSGHLDVVLKGDQRPQVPAQR
jgi:hypothetical protein